MWSSIHLFFNHNNNNKHEESQIEDLQSINQSMALNGRTSMNSMQFKCSIALSIFIPTTSTNREREKVYNNGRMNTSHHQQQQQEEEQIFTRRASCNLNSTLATQHVCCCCRCCFIWISNGCHWCGRARSDALHVCQRKKRMQGGRDCWGRRSGRWSRLPVRKAQMPQRL